MGNHRVAAPPRFAHFGHWCIYGHIVLTTGLPITDNIVVRDEAHALVAPVVAHSTVSNTYLVVWDDQDEGDIEGRVVNADGTIGIALNVFDAVTVTQPAIVYNSAANEYLVVFVYRDSPTNQDIYGQRVLANGTASGAAFAICSNTDGQVNPDIVYNATDDEYLVVWYDERNLATSGWDLYGQTVNPDGSLYLGTISYFVFTGDQQRPAGDFDPQANRGLTVWQDNRNGVTFKIYGRIKEPRFPVYLPLVLQDYQ